MLTYDSADRITVPEALGHPYLKQLHFPDDEPETESVSAFDFDFEKYSKTCKYPNHNHLYLSKFLFQYSVKESLLLREILFHLAQKHPTRKFMQI